MKLHNLLALTLGGCFAATNLHAGTMVSDGKDSKKLVEPLCPRTWFPDDPAGLVTVGTLFSKHLSGVYADSITGLWAPCERDAFLFLNSKYHYEDNGQYIQSTGLGFRKMIPGHDVIVGVNGYYDAVNSMYDNDFKQAGFGVEILTDYIDARFNYYLPEDKQYEVDRFSKRDNFTTFGPGFVEETSRRRSYKVLEAPLEGLNTEIGFLVPGLDKYTEVRFFGGYHHYNNPYGKDFEGFQARMEARLLKGVIADVEYWDDTALMGGHWTAGVRASFPFSLWALGHGHNPFEGIMDELKPGKREFKERMGEMVMRSHRIWTTTGKVKTRDTTDVDRFPGGNDSAVGGPGGPGDIFE